MGLREFHPGFPQAAEDLRIGLGSTRLEPRFEVAKRRRPHEHKIGRRNPLADLQGTGDFNFEENRSAGFETLEHGSRGSAIILVVVFRPFEKVTPIDRFSKRCLAFEVIIHAVDFPEAWRARGAGDRKGQV